MAQPWPQVLPFEKGPIRMEAILHRQDHEPDWQGYAIGYRRAVEALTDHIDTTATYQDTLAKALAYCWQSARDFPPSVRAVFNASPIELFQGITMLLGIPERRVPLPGRGKASQTDLFVLAKSGDDLVSIAVEGKVAEPFDVLVSEWLVRPSASAEGEEQGAALDEAPDQAPGPSPGKLRRLAYLCQMLGIDEEAGRPLRYQLLHRTVSALIEAERFNARHALMLVHSFSPTGDWFDDDRSFAALLGVAVEPDTIAHVGERAGVDLYLGWVKGEPDWLAV